MVLCPVCSKQVKSSSINLHIDSGCEKFLLDTDPTSSSSSSSSQQQRTSPPPSRTQDLPVPSSAQKRSAATFFSAPAAKRQATSEKVLGTPTVNGFKTNGVKRSYAEGPGRSSPTPTNGAGDEIMEDGGQEQQQPTQVSPRPERLVKRPKTRGSVPLAERMRPRTLDEVSGQDLVGPRGILRHLIETDQVPSMILWGGSGTGKTTIARCIAEKAKSRFIELNATSTGVAEVKKYFAEAANELQLTGRKTIIFCDEIHRFSKAQQDVFLKPVEAGTITLIGATTENPSFKVQAALLSRCRTFTLTKLTVDDIEAVLLRALRSEQELNPSRTISPLIDKDLLSYLATFSDGDARTALNLLELTLGLTAKPSTPDSPITTETIKASLTKTMVYDRAGDQHYDTISAFHKSVRGSDPDAAIYYLARMIQSGEDPLFIARRMVVIASEDVGLADNTMITLATSTFTAVQQIGLPEGRIPLAHCAIALALAPKSVRVYRALNNANSCLAEPGAAGLPIPLHLRNAPTRLMKEMGYGEEYKYPPNYVDGRCRQEYMPSGLEGRRFLGERDLGTEVDPEVDPVVEGEENEDVEEAVEQKVEDMVKDDVKEDLREPVEKPVEESVEEPVGEDVKEDAKEDVKDITEDVKEDIVEDVKVEEKAAVC
jgi:putative ATPase